MIWFIGWSNEYSNIGEVSKTGSLARLARWRASNLLLVAKGVERLKREMRNARREASSLIPETKKPAALGLPVDFGGLERIRTAVQAFAEPCLTSRPRDHGGVQK